jgi:hypothetical protein
LLLFSGHLDNTAISLGNLFLKQLFKGLGFGNDWKFVDIQVLALVMKQILIEQGVLIARTLRLLVLRREVVVQYLFLLSV